MERHDYALVGPDEADTNCSYVNLEATNKTLDRDTNEITSFSKYDEAKSILKRSLPLNIAYLLRFSHSFTTLYVINSAPRQIIHAVSLAIAIYNITGFALFEGLIGGLDTLFSQAYGARKFHLVGVHAQKFLCFAALAFLPVAMLWLLSSQILGFFVLSKAEAGLCGRYLRITILAVPGHVLFEVGKRFVLVQGQIAILLYVTMLTTPMHLGLSWCFVRYFHWGIEGAALANVLTNAMNAVLVLLYVCYLKPECLVCWPGLTRSAFKDWASMTRLCFTSMIVVESEWVAFDILAVCASYISTNSLATYSVASMAMSILYQVPLSTSLATSLRIGYLVGRERSDLIPRVSSVHLMTGVVTGLFNSVLVLVFRNFASMLYTINSETKTILSDALIIVSVVVFFDATAAMTNGILRGARKQSFGRWVSVTGYCALTVPISLLPAFGQSQLGISGILIGLMCGLFLISVVEIFYIWQIDWTKIVLA